MKKIKAPYKYSLLFTSILAASQPLKAIELEEVVVVAQKREQSANDIGMAISAVSGDDLRELGVLDTRDMAAVVPGLTYTNTGDGPPIYTLRGIGFNDPSYNGGSTVGVYIDGAGLPFPMMTLGATIDMERVEVLKGPQGTLYGRNNTGGAINFISKKPTEVLEAGLSGTYSSYDSKTIEGYLSGPISERIGARIAIKTTDASEGWQENRINDDTLGEISQNAVRVNITAQLTDDLDAQFQAGWWQDKSDVQAPQILRTHYQNPTNTPVISILEPHLLAAAATGHDSEIAGWTLSGQDFEYDLESVSTSATFNYHLNDDTVFTSVTNWVRLDDNGSLFSRDGFTGTPISALPQNPPGAYLFSADLAGLNGGQPFPIADLAGISYLANINQGNDAVLETFSQEFRVAHETESANIIAGIYYAKDDAYAAIPNEVLFTSNTNGLGGSPFINFAAFEGRVSQDTEIMGAFFHSEWQLNDDWRFTAATRYSEDTTDFQGCNLDPGNGALTSFFTLVTPNLVQPGECGSILGASLDLGEARDQLKEDSWSWRFALDWNATDNTLLYTSLSRGFKAGSFPNVPATNTIQYAPATQERLDALEFGFKSTLQDGTLQLNGAVFYYDYKDKQVYTSIPDPIGVFGTLRVLGNVPDSRVYGAELDLQWQPMDGLYIAAGVSYLDTKIDKFTGTTLTGTTDVNFDGSPFPNTADFQANLLVNYSWEIQDGIEMYVGADATYSDEIQSDLVPSDRPTDKDFLIDSVTNINFRWGVQDTNDTWRVFAWSRNLTDEYSRNNVSRPVDTVIAYTSMPRTYGLTLEYNYH